VRGAVRPKSPAARQFGAKLPSGQRVHVRFVEADVWHRRFELCGSVGF